MAKTGVIISERLVKKGWSALVRSLGLEKALRFVVTLERGEGDSVLELKKIWKGKNSSVIHKEILEAKALGKI
ncbi:MAG: hypothetical protein HYS08_06240 [Chlamydiae bacterium]|nr:hypothetical protein [Chlamydiota bacterium]